MAQNIEVIGLDEVSEILNKLPEHSFDAAKQAFRKAALETHNTVEARIGNGSPLHNRTGRLRRSIQFRTDGQSLQTLKSKVFSDVVYAPIHETGGTIKAKDKYLRVKGGPYLNIPLSANKTAAGVMRMGAREVFNAGGFIIKSKKGNYLVMSGTGQPMFVLKKQITIPARLGMMDAANDSIPTLLSTLSDELLRGA